MSWLSGRSLVRLGVVLLAVVSLAGCGGGADGPSGARISRFLTPSAATVSATPATETSIPSGRPTPTGNSAATASPTSAVLAVAQSCRLENARPPNDAQVPASTVIRTYRDVGPTVTLEQGRGNDQSGDYGWAHVRNKHLYGVWSGGGLVTTFPEIGICSELGVQDAIGRALREGRRHEESGGRAVYAWPVPNARFDVLVVVGADGTIITAYPARR